MTASLLLLSDDPLIAHDLASILRSQGHNLSASTSSSEALDALGRHPVDLAVLDTDLPEGLDLCREHTRVAPNTPFVVVSRRAAEVDRVVGLSLGAEDYVAKPFSVQELALRLRAILRRTAPEDPASPVFQVGRLRVDAETQRAWVDGDELELSPLEAGVLGVLASNPGRFWRREDIVMLAWPEDARGDSRVVDSVIKRLRRKLGPAREQLRTMRGLGYRLEA